MAAKKIGLFGGAFDPVHLGHVNIACSAIEQLGLDELWLLIDGQPRGKENCSSFKHRLEMAKLAFADNPKVKVDQHPFQIDGRTHGLGSMKEIYSSDPKAEFYLLAGIDALEHFQHWESPEIFCRLVSFAVMPRRGKGRREVEKIKSSLGDYAPEFKYEILRAPDYPESSSEIRRQLSLGVKAGSLDPGVLEYIEANSLYFSR